MKHTGILIVIVLALCVILVGTVAAQANKPEAAAAAITTKFMYQGQLERNGALFTGTCDMQFSLWDADAAGTRQGEAFIVNAINIDNGVFTVELDFGNQFKGGARWLQPEAKCADDADFMALPRVELNPAPYAIGLMPGAVVDGDIPYGAGDAALKVINTSASDGTALFGQTTATSGDTAGVYGLSASPNGAGVWGETDADNAKGVVGFGRDPCPPGSPAICGQTHARNANGVVGEALAFGAGVWGRSKSGNGVYGETSEANTFDIAGVLGRSTGSGGLGVKGEANVGNGWGVYGVSTAGSGVVGTTAAANTFDRPGVLGRSTGDGGIGVKGEANVGNGWGVYGTSTAGKGVVGVAASGAGVYGSSGTNVGVWGESADFEGVRGVSHNANHGGVVGINDAAGGTAIYGVSAAGPGVVGQSTSGYAMQAVGHATQSPAASGWVKAMVSVDPSRPSGQQIVQCFNSQLPASAATTPPCGMTATGSFVGGWNVDFGFDVTGRFVALTIHFTGLCFQYGPHCAIAGETSYPGGTGVNVWIKYAGDGQLTNTPFTLILY